MRFEGPGEITRGRQARPTFLFLSFVPALRSLFSAGKGHHLLFELIYAVALVAVACEVIWMRRRRIRERAGVLSGDEVGVSIDGEIVIAGRDIEAAYVMSTSDSTVRIERRRAPAVGLRLQTTEDARALVESLGFGVAHAPLRVGATRGKAVAAWLVASGALVAVLAGAASGLGRSGLALGMAAVVLPFLVLAGVWASLKVVVGTDGLLLGPAFRREFIPHPLIAGASVERGAVTISLRSGRRIRIMPVQITAETLVASIEEARALAAQAPGATSAAAALLMPGDRALGAWVADLLSLASDGTYREVPVEADDLRRVMDDPKAPPPARAGAAAALARQGDGEARARTEMAARASANPKLRVALSRIAAGEIEVEAERALEPLLRESLRTGER